MKTSRFKSLLIITLLIFSLPWSCAQNSSKSKILHLYLDTDPTTLDPALMTDVRSGRLSALIYDTLIGYDRDLNLQPHLARTCEISSDGKTYHFSLKENISFSNGSPLTAEDVLFSLERLAHPKTMSGRSWILSHVKGFEDFRSGKSDHLIGLQKKNNYEIMITLEKPFSPFLSLLTMPNASIISKDSFLKNKLIGTGPFILDYWKHDYEIFLKRNDVYYEEKAKIDGISFRIIKETLFVSSEFRRGRLDIIEIPGPEIPLYQKQPQWKDKILIQDNLSLYYLGYNCQKLPFSQKEFRKMIDALIDKKTIVHTLRKERAVLLNGPIPSVLLQDNKLILNSFGQDEARQWIKNHSKQLNDQPLILLQSANEETLELSEAIQSQLKEAGLQSKIVVQEWSAFKTRLIDGDFDFFILSWWADYPDAENFLYPLFHSTNFGNGGNYTRFQNVQVNHLIEKAQYTSDKEERDLLYREIQEKVVEDCPITFLYSSRSILVQQPRIKNFSPHPLYNGEKFTQIEIN